MTALTLPTKHRTYGILSGLALTAVLIRRCALGW